MCTPCPAGQYGNTSRLQSSQCTAMCPAGFFCPAGSITYTTNVCAAGYYCLAGASSGTQYVVPAGYYAPPGTGSPNAFACPAGQYSTGIGVELACEALVLRLRCVGLAHVWQCHSRLLPTGRWRVKLHSVPHGAIRRVVECADQRRMQRHLLSRLLLSAWFRKHDCDLVVRASVDWVCACLQWGPYWPWPRWFTVKRVSCLRAVQSGWQCL